METVVKARIIKIGNSQGIRLPKVWLDQLNFNDEVEVVVQSDQLVIRSPYHARQGGEQKFATMAQYGDDTLLDPATPSRWEQEEWEW